MHKDDMQERDLQERRVTEQLVEGFCRHLIGEEKSAATVEKYLRDVRAFAAFAGGKSVNRELVMAYKRHLQERYAVRSVNSMLASLNSFWAFVGWQDCRVKALKLQKQIFCAEEKELTRAEYERLLQAARGNRTLWLLMQTICATGIRVSELRFFTVEAVRRGQVVVDCKAKNRTVLIPGKLRRRLLDYAAKRRIGRGMIFVTRRGGAFNRQTVWAQMKSLCAAAGVARGKVFPHNLRKLFARSFYSLEKDIAKLADILGHSSIDTTRIYIMSSGAEHRRKLERLGLVV